MTKITDSSDYIKLYLVAPCILFPCNTVLSSLFKMVEDSSMVSDSCHELLRKGFVSIWLILIHFEQWLIFSLKTYMSIFLSPNIFCSSISAKKHKAHMKRLWNTSVNISESSRQLHYLLMANLFMINISHYD